MQNLASASEVNPNIRKFNPCPCCGANAKVLDVMDKQSRKHTVKIWCSQWGCRSVSAENVWDAAELWNAPDFRSAHP